MYRGVSISTYKNEMNGRTYWVAYSRGSLIACERSKEQLFEAVDALFGK